MPINPNQPGVGAAITREDHRRVGGLNRGVVASILPYRMSAGIAPRWSAPQINPSPAWGHRSIGTKSTNTQKQIEAAISINPISPCHRPQSG